MLFLYTLGMYAYRLALHLATFFHPKAQKWVTGRKNWRLRYQQEFRKKGPVLWVHAASLGEFEQGRPIIEAWRTRFPDWQIVLTFFSPSGYEVRHNYSQADFVAYLPADTPQNAADFVDLIQPDTVVFVKYEFWFNYLNELHRRGIPVVLASALFRPKQPFFQVWGGFWRDGLTAFTHFFVQDEASVSLLQGIGFENVTQAGDTRIDRVLQIAAEAPENEIVARFVNTPVASPETTVEKVPVFIAGSAWEADEAVFLPAVQSTNWKIIVAPHEPTEKHVQQLLDFPESIRYSQAGPGELSARVLVIDNVGLLNTLYRYGTVAYIGGGFGAGIHNTLEPAAFGLPILFGPKYTKFAEARAFIALGAAFAVRHADELAAVLQQLENPDFYQKASRAALDFLEQNRGATEKVVAFLATFVAGTANPSKN